MTSQGICLLSHVPLRREPSERSEMVTQLLFGDLGRVYEVRNGWIRIVTEYDEYEGWLSALQWQTLEEEAYAKYCVTWRYAVADLNAIVREEGRQIRYPIIIGSSLPRMSRGHFKAGDLHYAFEGSYTSPVMKAGEKSVVRTARKFLGAPYLWGGRSPYGIDCSGLVQIVFKVNHIRLPRDARQQVGYGLPIDFLAEARPGDVAFFDDEEGNIIHTGIIAGNRHILHACGSVRMDTLDHQGIFNAAEKRYSHKLRIIKRVIPQ